MRESLPYRRLFCAKLSVGSKTTERLNGRIYVEILQESRPSRSGFSRDNTLAADAVGATLNDEQL